MTQPHPLLAVEQLVGAHAALCAAGASGMLAQLAEQPAAASELAASLGADARVVDAILHVLAAGRVVVPVGDGRYAASPELPVLLDLLEDLYTGLRGALAGQPSTPSVATAGGAGSFYPEVVAMLARAFAQPAEDVAATLARPGLRVLDAGAGGAPWSLAVVAREPSCQVVAVDVPEVLTVTRGQVAAAGREDRYGFLAADLFSIDPEPTYDLVLAGNLCHLFAAERAAELVERLAATLVPGGTLAVIDVPADPPDAQELGTAVYRLGLALRTDEGGLHTRDDYRRWFAAAGLEPDEQRRVDGTAAWLVTGRCPARRVGA